MPTSGGWLKQPLDLYMQILAIDMIYDATNYIVNTKDADWTELPMTQSGLYWWVKNG